MEGLSARLQELADRAEVADLVMGLARAQDEKDWDGVRRAYLPAARYEHPGGVLDGVEEIVARTRRALEALDASQHLLGTQQITVAGDEARSRCYFHAQHVRQDAPGGEHYVIAGTYADQLVRTPQGWRIAERVQAYQWRSGNRDVVTR